MLSVRHRVAHASISWSEYETSQFSAILRFRIHAHAVDVHPGAPRAERLRCGVAEQNRSGATSFASRKRRDDGRQSKVLAGSQLGQAGFAFIRSRNTRAIS